VKVTTIITQFLKKHGISTIFELQGGMITSIIDEMHRMGGINIVSMHHEQGAGFAADAYARINNQPGVALATSGPGATNLITAIGGCFFDSVPAIFITGQVNLNEQKGDKPTRQIGFQETDIVSVVRPITKAAFAVTDAEDIPAILEKAYTISMEGRPGPVLIDIPMNIQNVDVQNTPPESDAEGYSYAKTGSISDFITEFQSALKSSKRPLCLVGRGVRAGAVTDKIIGFIEKYNLPLVTSLLAIDTIPYNHPNRVGFIGTYGNRWANYALGTCDVLIVLGSRLDLRQTGSDMDTFRLNKRIFHVDIDESELNNRVKDCITLNVGLRDFFEQEIKTDNAGFVFEDWFKEIHCRYLKLPDTNELKAIKGINPNKFIHSLSEASHQAKAFTTDVGNNQMWAAQSIEILPEQHFLSSGGMGAMGYSLPAAIGAAFAIKGSPVVAISGDGGFQINIQELQTIVRNKLPIKIVILNNHCLGMIRQFQDTYFDKCYQSTVWGYDAPDFVKIANAYGIEACSITEVSEIETGLSLLWKDPQQPFLLNVNLDIHTNVYPKTIFGNPITRMEPEDNLDLDEV